MSNNAWTNSGAGPRQPPGNQSNAVASQGSAAPKFNAQEVRDCLKNEMGTQRLHHIKRLEALRTVTRDQVVPGRQNVPNNMNNNKDFYSELRKQVTNMQQGGERAGG
uniref:Uncharacterized protein n=1 Tax=Cladonia uncialis subsp. uncialis TaxID=180999 RepID=A0A2K9YE60_CLAUC|nr:hypothetical protein [Cladonia uncialis subsp. uncialis]